MKADGIRIVPFLSIDYLYYKNIYLQISEERKERVMNLYFNQHKTYAEIAEIEHISPRDIHTIVKEEESRRRRLKDQQQQEELSSKAYKLFSEGKRPVEVAIALNLREPEATKLFIEYWRLKRQHILISIHKETNGKLGPFLKLYKLLIKQRSMSIEKVANVVDIDIHKLPYMESLYEQAKDEVDKMQRTREETENYLHTLNYEIASAKALLNSYNMLCEWKRQEAENLNEISRLETLVSRFKSNDEEYLKIKKTVEEEVSKSLKDGKVLLQFSLASVIEAIRRNTDKYNNNLLVSNTSSSSTSTPTQGSILSHIEGYRDMILEEANGLYESLLHHFTYSIMDNTVSKWRHRRLYCLGHIYLGLILKFKWSFPYYRYNLMVFRNFGP